MYNVIAFQIADHIDIKEVKKSYAGTAMHSDLSEVLYGDKDNKYFYVLAYGVVVFVGYDEAEMSKLIEFISPYCKNILKEKLMEELTIKVDGKNDIFGYNEISVTRFEPMVVKIIMMNVAQSVAIDHFTRQIELLLEETHLYTSQLEKTGKSNISGIRLRKFIGKSLNLKNQISENLYILDSPAETWEDEYLNKIDGRLKKMFDFNIRYRSINEDIQIIKDNLDLFRDLMQHEKSNLLEWIIIALILVEVLDMIIGRLF